MSLSRLKLRPDSEVLQLTLSYRLLLFFAAIPVAMAADLHNCAAGDHRREHLSIQTAQSQTKKHKSFQNITRMQTAPLLDWDAGPLLQRRLSICLASEESRDIELILLSRIMHRCRAAMGIQTLGSRPAGIFGNRLGRPAFRLPCRRTLHWTLKLRHGPRGPGRGRRHWRLGFRPPANAD